MKGNKGCEVCVGVSTHSENRDHGERVDWYIILISLRGWMIERFILDAAHWVDRSCLRSCQERTTIMIVGDISRFQKLVSWHIYHESSTSVFIHRGLPCHRIWLCLAMMVTSKTVQHGIKNPGMGTGFYLQHHTHLEPFFKKLHIARLQWHTPLVPASEANVGGSLWVQDQFGLQSEFQGYKGETESPKAKTKTYILLMCSLNLEAGIRC